MDNQTVEELAQFCADQYYLFDAGEWLKKTEQYHRIPLALAKYLSGTSWYGHAEQLDSISTMARSQLLVGPAADVADDRETIDIARFSGVIRVRIAQMRMQKPQYDFQTGAH